jgi:hypothetical protein
MTTEVILARGQIALIDDEDAELVLRWKWHLGTWGYVTRTILRGEKMLLHRLLLSPPDGFQVDHINNDKLDNRRHNLRVCTAAENQRNRGALRGSLSKYKGVVFHYATGRWQAQISVDRRHIYLGLFDCEHEAATAVNVAVLKYHGEFAWLNKIDQSPSPHFANNQLAFLKAFIARMVRSAVVPSEEEFIRAEQALSNIESGLI